ncbi:MAG: hypothetical protein QW096_08260 [Thermofilaceae archaeon]
MVQKIVFTAFLAFSLLYVTVAFPQHVVIVEYGMSGCPHCVEQKAVLEGLWEEGKLYFVYVELMGNETNALEYVTLYDILGLYDLEGDYYVPLLVITVDDNVKGITVGYHNTSQLLYLIDQSTRAPCLKVWSSSGTVEITNETIILYVQQILGNRLSFTSTTESPGKPTGSHETPAQKQLSPIEALSILIPLAASDSVNPCTFAVYTTLLTTVLVLGGARKMLASALAFITAVFTCYYILGVGLVTATTMLPAWFIKVLAALGLVAGIYSIAVSLRGDFKSPIPDKLKRVTESALFKVAGPLGAAGLGALCSFTLLPCSSGPYIVFAGVLSRIPTFMLRYLLLAVYNLIFVTPLVALAVVISVFRVKARRLKQLRDERTLTVMELAGGVLLASICAWILVTF